HLGRRVIGVDGQYAIQERFFLNIQPAKLVGTRSFLQRENVAWVELDGTLQVPHGFFPTPLTPLDESCQFEYPWRIRQELTRKFQLSQCTIVIEIPLIKIQRAGKVHFPCTGTNTKCCLDGSFRCRQTSRRMVIAEEIKIIMRFSELAIGLEE